MRALMVVHGLLNLAAMLIVWMAVSDLLGFDFMTSMAGCWLVGVFSAKL